MFAETGQVNIIEIVWTFVGVAGIVLSSYCIADAYKDLKVIRQHNINHGMELVSTSNLYTELARLAEQSIVAIIGIYACTLAP